jgi:hypothetical protein
MRARSPVQGRRPSDPVTDVHLCAGASPEPAARGQRTPASWYGRLVSRPDWWEWELEFTPHLEKRMGDRGFTEVDLRSMLEHARGHRPDVVEGRFVVETQHNRRPWEVVVEPDEVEHLLVVVTAYGVDP